MGGEAFKHQVATIRKNPEVLIATPGRLVDHIEKGTPDFNDLEMLVLDEADRMLDMGFALDMETVAQHWAKATGLVDKHAPRRLVVDASGVDYCDGAGMGLLVELRRCQLSRGGEVEVEGLGDENQRLLGALKDMSSENGRKKAQRSVATEVGKVAAHFWRDIVHQITFTGELVVAFLRVAANPRRLRWKDFWLAAERAGIDALPIVALITFLIGLILGFQSSVAMRPYGADIYVPNLIAIMLFRELGPLMTAILLAGRTGSSFAAELGTMKVNEEIDALTTMGLDPVRFLVVTRMLAVVIMTPMLTLFGIFAGLVGGAVVFLSLGYPLIVYTNQVVGAVNLTDLTGGLFKTVVFGFLIASIGCLRGLQTLKGASAVGISTTRAVVAGIFLIILSDGIFAVLYYYLGI